MEKFTKLTGVAAPMPVVNIDTDMIIPKDYLKTIKRTGLGKGLFAESRYLEDGSPNPDFVLNKPAYQNAQILVAGDNFGCGSSREHAAWALGDLGIKVVIAPSFSDIFSGNAFKNGILTVVLPQEAIDRLMEVAKTDPIHVDLEQQSVTTQYQDRFSFEIDPFRKHCLLGGLDEIGLTLDEADVIDAFEAKDAALRPWLVPAVA